MFQTEEPSLWRLRSTEEQQWPSEELTLGPLVVFMAVLETKPFEPSEDPAETSMNGSAARTMNALKLGMTREGLLARRG